MVFGLVLGIVCGVVGSFSLGVFHDYEDRDR
jgi:hypothetical protein